MTRIKLCGLSRLQDIETANTLLPEYVGFVFAPKSRRYVTRQHAADLKRHLAPGIRAVGVFVDEPPENVAKIVKRGIIDLVQLHGSEDEMYLRRLRELTAAPIIQAFRVRSGKELPAAGRCSSFTGAAISFLSPIFTGSGASCSLIRRLPELSSWLTTVPLPRISIPLPWRTLSLLTAIF